MKRVAMKREPAPEGRALTLASARHAGLRILVGAIVALCATQAVGQAARGAGAATAAPLREEGVRWQTLTPSQREALRSSATGPASTPRASRNGSRWRRE